MTAVLIGIAHHHVPAVGGTGQGQHMAHNGKRRAHQGLAVNKLRVTCVPWAIQSSHIPPSVW